MSYIFSGFADEAGHEIEAQIRATKELGWTNIEMRNVKVGDFPAGNLHDIPEEAFLQVVEKISEANLRIHCFGSAIANGAKSIEKPFDVDLEASKRAATRMPKLGSKFIRIMSYPILKGEDQMEQERFRRLREIVAIFQGAGVTVVHENCGNYGGMGWTFTLKLLENVPGLKLVFDMGNCFHDLDYTKKAPYPCQSSWEFYEKVRDHIVHMHIKDGRVTEDGKNIHTYPGEGTCDVKRIIDDLLAHGYKNVFSIEPHIGIAPEFSSLPEAEAKYRTYVKHGQVLETLFPKA